MRDPMTPLERFSMLLMDEAPDRLISAPLLTTHAATVAGLSPGRCCDDGLVMAQAQLLAQARYGHDAFCVFSDVGILAEALGSTYRHREDDVPILEEPVVKGPDDLKKLRMPGPYFGRLAFYTDAVKRLYAEKGDRIPTFCMVPAPFTTAAGLRGMEDFLVDTITDPPFAHAVLRVAEEIAANVMDAIVLAGGLPALADPLASASVASPATYREFAMPGTKRLIDRLHRLDLDVVLHICGETAPILDDIAATGADLLSFDKTDVAVVRDRIGDRVRLVGNVSPQSVLSATPEEVALETRLAARMGAGTPKGFVISTGCEIPIRSPEENVMAFMRAARAAGDSQ